MLVFVLAFAVIVIAALFVVQRYYTASDPPSATCFGLALRF